MKQVYALGLVNSIVKQLLIPRSWSRWPLHFEARLRGAGQICRVSDQLEAFLRSLSAPLVSPPELLKAPAK